MNIITKELLQLSKFKEYITELKKEKASITISGLSDVGKIEFIASTQEAIKRPICIVTYNEMQAKSIQENLKFFVNSIDYFPKREIVAYDFIAESKDLPYERIDLLNKLKENKVDIVVTTIEALMQKMICKKELFKNVFELKIGDTFDFEALKERLVYLGYERADLVEARGQFSIRGGIVDIALDNKKGIRIEFWGDDVDSIREFNISSQRSETMLDKATIYPAHELLLEEELNVIVDRIRATKEKENDKKHVIQEIKDKDIELIESGDYLNKIDKYFNNFYLKQDSFLGYLGDDFIIIFDEFGKINQRKDSIIIENNNLIKSLIEKERFVPQAIENLSDYKLDIDRDSIVYLEKQDVGLSTSNSLKYTFNYRDVNYYKSEIEILFEDIKKDINKKKIVVLAGSEEEANRFGELLSEANIPNQVLTSSMQITKKVNNDNKNLVFVMQGKLSGGFENYDCNLIVISGEELFSTSKKKRALSKTFKQGERVVFSDLKVGDYVVHKVHGIGQFIGVNTIKTTDGVTKDYIKIRYRNDDMLYIPTNDLDSIRKYIGEGEQVPKINRLRK